MSERKLPRKYSPKDKWLKILKILAEMPKDERDRCIRATAAFFEGRET